MENFKIIIKKSSWFLFPYCVLLLSCVLILIMYSKSEIHIWLNRHNSVFFDHFYSVITNLGDGTVIIPFCIFLLFFRVGNSIMAASTFAASGIFVQILKRLFFHGMPRPVQYFKGIYELHLVKGVGILSSNSFPSGHSASIFALCLCLSLMTRFKFLRFLSLILACIVGYSRIYLSQHFLSDVAAGSFIGVIVVLVYYYFHIRIKGEWINRSIQSILFSNHFKEISSDK